MANPDLTQKLTALGHHLRNLDSESPEGALMLEAADEITQLRRLLERTERAAYLAVMGTVR